MFYFYTFVYMCVCVYKPVSIYVYVYYIHKTLYIFSYKYAFIIQIIKMGEGFCFFLNRWRNLEDQKLDLIEFWCSFLFSFSSFFLNYIVRLWKMDFFFFPIILWLWSSSLNELSFLLVFIFVFVFEEITKPSCLQSDKGYSNGLNLPIVGRCFKNTSCVWIVAERFPWQCEEENSFCPIIINSWIECWFDLQA